MKERSFFSAMSLPLMGLLAALVILGACKHPTGFADDYSAQGNGYGRISVSFQAETKTARTGTQPRTLLPSLVFDKYVYTFTKTGETAGAELTPDSGGYFTLEVGSYTVEVKSFTLNEGSYVLTASGVSAQFNVISGDNNPVVVYLSPVAAGVLGEFSYTITYPDEARGEIALFKYPDMVDMGLAPSHVSEANGLSETLELEAGTYLLTVKVSKNGRYAGITEAVHIYPSLTTAYDKEFVDEDFTSISEPPVEPPVNKNVRIEYYWVDEHGSLITTSGGKVSIAPDETLAITAQGDGYTSQQWHLNGVDSGQSGNTFHFSSPIAGRHTVGLFVEKDGKLYNTNIVITVEGSSVQITRTVTVDMFDHLGDGWNGGSFLVIKVNGITIADNVRVGIANGQNTPAGQKYTNTYTFPVTTGDVVQVFWTAGLAQSENSFIVYYSGTPPLPAFTYENTSNWSGTNALIYKLRGTMTSISNDALLGEFTVSNPM